MQSHMFGYDIKDQYTDTTLQRDTITTTPPYYTGAAAPTQYGSGAKSSTLLYESPIVPDPCVLDSGLGVTGASGVNRTSSIHRPYKDIDLPPPLTTAHAFTGGQAIQQGSTRRDIL